MHLRNSEEAVENSQQPTPVLGYLCLRDFFFEMLLPSQLSSQHNGTEQRLGWAWVPDW